MMMYNLGDTVWIVRFSHEAVREQCPDCLGTAIWHCTLPSGEEFDVQCARCYHGGYEPSTGYVKERWVVAAIPVEQTIMGVAVDAAGKIEYRTNDCYCVTDAQIFPDATSAAHHGEEEQQRLAVQKMEEEVKQGRKRGRPRVKEANPMEFGGGSAEYARSQIRSAIKDIISWTAYAKTKGTLLDPLQDLSRALAK